MKMFKISTQMGEIFQFSKYYRKELCHEKGLKTHIIFCNMNREVSSVSLNRKFSSALTCTLRTPKVAVAVFLGWLCTAAVPVVCLISRFRFRLLSERKQEVLYKINCRIPSCDGRNKRSVYCKLSLYNQWRGATGYHRAAFEKQPKI